MNWSGKHEYEKGQHRIRPILEQICTHMRMAVLIMVVVVIVIEQILLCIRTDVCCAVQSILGTIRAVAIHLSILSVLIR